MGNEIIITEISFYINNFKGTHKDYSVQAYAQDITNSDHYTINIYDMTINNLKLEPIEILYADCCGGILLADNISDIGKYVLEILFNLTPQRLIKAF